MQRQRIWKRGKVWHGAVYIDGKRYCRSTKRCDRKAAESVVAEWERAAPDPAHAAAHAATLKTAMDAMIRDRFEKAKAGRGSEATVRFYVQKCGHFMRLLESHGATPFPLTKLEPPFGATVVDNYISQRRAEYASESTIAKELVALRATLKLARRRGLYRGDPAAILPCAFSPAYKPRERWLSFDESQKVLALLTPDRAAFIIATSANWGEWLLGQDSNLRPAD